MHRRVYAGCELRIKGRSLAFARVDQREQLSAFLEQQTTGLAVFGVREGTLPLRIVRCEGEQKQSMIGGDVL
jgi:hypothetical protein